jgi:hypothetical protein
MHLCLHSRSLNRSLRLFCLIALTHCAIAEPNCAVSEERGLWTITGRFSVGSGAVSLTLPWSLYAEGAVLFQEVAAGVPASALFLDTGEDRAPVEDGGAISVKPKQGGRIVITLRDEAGQPLCMWTPSVRQLKGSAPVSPDGFLKGNFLSRYSAEGNSESLFRNTGEPILLGVGGKLAAGHGIYRIDDLPATILARTSHQVVLRDPQPKTGLRTVESQGYAITIPFVEVRMSLPSPAEARSGTIQIEVLGADAVRQPGNDAVWPRPSLLLINSSQDRIQLLCGRSFQEDADHDDARDVALTREPGGGMKGACKFKYTAAGPVELRGLVVLFPSRLRQPHLSLPPRVRLPFEDVSAGERRN